MTDEEKKALEILKDREYDFDELYGTFRQSFIKPYDKSIGIILELIEKQSKEIEELKAINKKLEARKYMYNAETGEVTAIPIDNNYISKDKIKAKILECREILYSFEKELELKANKEKYIHKESMNCLLSQISILQSLLEKE